ncbi:hypothetical protein EMIT0158MI4_80303 [Burkholderia ambifaria]
MRLGAVAVSARSGIAWIRRSSSSSDSGCRLPGASRSPSASSVSAPADSRPKYASRPHASAASTFASRASDVRMPSSGSRLSKNHWTGRSVDVSVKVSARSANAGDSGYAAADASHCGSYANDQIPLSSVSVPMRTPLADAISVLAAMAAPAALRGLQRGGFRNLDRRLRVQAHAEFAQQQHDLADLGGRLSGFDLADEFRRQPGRVREFVAREPLLEPRRANEVGERADRVDGLGLRHDVLRASYLIGNSMAQRAGPGTISYPFRNEDAFTARRRVISYPIGNGGAFNHRMRLFPYPIGYVESVMWRSRIARAVGLEPCVPGVSSAVVPRHISHHDLHGGAHGADAGRTSLDRCSPQDRAGARRGRAGRPRSQ